MQLKSYCVSLIVLANNMSVVSWASDACTQFLSFMMDMQAELISSSHGIIRRNSASSAHDCMSSDEA